MENDILIAIFGIALATLVFGISLLQKVAYHLGKKKYTSKEVWDLINKLEEGFKAEDKVNENSALKGLKNFSIPLSILDHKYDTNFNVILFCRDTSKDHLFNVHLAYHMLRILTPPFTRKRRREFGFSWFFYFEPLSRMPLHLNDDLPRRIVAEWRLNLGK